MSEPFEVVTKFFQEDEWQYQQLDNRSVFRLQYRGQSGEWSCYADLRLETFQFLFYSVCPTYVPAKDYARIAEFLARANYGLVLGNFELDYSDGQVRFKTSIDFEDSQLDPIIMRNLVYANLQTMDIYISGIMSLLFSEKSPEQVIQEIERS